MNKEQFKKSLFEVMNFYIEQLVGFNVNAKDAQDNQNITLFNMIQTQANAAGQVFEQGLEEILNQVFPEEQPPMEETVAEEEQ